jgi:uncharacterized RDD family membrane protein YckC
MEPSNPKRDFLGCLTATAVFAVILFAGQVLAKYLDLFTDPGTIGFAISVLSWVAAAAVAYHARRLVHAKFETSTPDSENFTQELAPEAEPLVDATRIRRLVNLFIDTQVVGLPLGFLALLITILILGLVDSLDNSLAFYTVGYIVILALLFMYYFVLESVFHRTVGKLITGTVVVADNGGNPTRRQILLRTLSRLVPFEFVSFSGPRPRGWHDRWSRTRVVVRPKTRRNATFGVVSSHGAKFAPTRETSQAVAGKLPADSAGSSPIQAEPPGSETSRAQGSELTTQKRITVHRLDPLTGAKAFAVQLTAGTRYRIEFESNFIEPGTVVISAEGNQFLARKSDLER